MNKAVNFEIAKLLKDKGFDKYCHSGYTEKGDAYLHQGGQEPVKNGQGYYEGRSYTGGEFYCSAPTIAEVVMWLYEKHGIWIEVSCLTLLDEKDDTIEVDLFYFVASKFKPVEILYSGDFVNSPTEAYEDAITYTLKKLI